MHRSVTDAASVGVKLKQIACQSHDSSAAVCHVVQSAFTVLSVYRTLHDRPT